MPALARTVSLVGGVLAALLATAVPAQASLPTADRAAPHASDCFRPSAMGVAARTGSRPADTSPVDAATMRAVQRRLATARTHGGPSAARAAVPVSIPVYVHVMRDRRGRGNVTAGQIAAQIRVLNSTYAGAELPGVAADTGFSFWLAGVNRFRNTAWHEDRHSATYRRHTRQGGAGALNVWVVGFRSVRSLGIATFPWEYDAHPRLDGIRVQVASLPGGALTNYNLGKTATHEAGHWLGLFHTFQGGCSLNNDGIADTPAQSTPTSGCPADSHDTCSLPGVDPIHNYLDYSTDPCYNQFTPEQAQVMQAWFAELRS